MPFVWDPRERIPQIKGLRTIAGEVVQAARENLIIGEARADRATKRCNKRAK
ncbi:MAG: hypothetical protein M3Q65_23900 [Chloroflexota bacterium]|nr:hypothetical protein [Chloroflexota bacterium]